LRTSKTLRSGGAVVAVSLAAACANSQAKDETKTASRGSQPTATPPPVDVATAPGDTPEICTGGVRLSDRLPPTKRSRLRGSPRDFRRFQRRFSAISWVSGRARSSRRLTSATRSSSRTGEATLKQTLARLGMKEEKIRFGSERRREGGESQLDGRSWNWTSA